MGQGFFDVMFADLDRSLRETGVGDLSVGKHVKRMAQGFYGRMRAYQEGLAGDDATLTAAIERNVFGTTAGPAPMAAILGAYMRAAAAALQHQSIGHLLAGEFCFASLQACERAGPGVKADAS